MKFVKIPFISIRSLLISAVFILPINSFASSINFTGDFLCHGYLPDSLEPDPIPLNGYTNHALSEKKFKEMIALGVKEYSDIIRGHGATLTINNYWTDEKVNASAKKEGSSWAVNMYGGLARLKNITKDSLTSVMCHEIGHLVGGFPEYSKNQDMASEGQSDFFAGHACFKRIFKEDIEVNATFRDKVQEYPKKSCDAVYESQENRDVCYRTAVASYKFWRAVREHVKWGFKNRDKRIVSITYDQHPVAQCRLDTALASALCLDKWDDHKIPDNQNHNTCNCSRGKYVDDYRVGLRPKCWYKPNQSGGTFDPRVD